MSFQYDQYLTEHKANVRKAFGWLNSNIPELTIGVIDLEWTICHSHDWSKNEADEYGPYDAYFYGGNRSYFVTQEFKKAWLLHIHRNPHHWQYYVLNNDEPEEGEVILEMPLDRIIEMICDWWAFSWVSGDLAGIFDWYESHKSYIKFNPNTRGIVEDILDRMGLKLGDEVR